MESQVITPDNHPREVSDLPEPSPPASPQKAKAPKSKRKILLIVLAATAVLIIGGLLAYTMTKSKEEATTSSNIVIGDTTITPEDISRYVNSINKYKEQNPDVAFESTPEETAVNNLVMNAALKKEAKDLNKSLDQNDVKQLYDISLENSGYQTYLDGVKSSDTSAYYDMVTKENRFLQNKLGNELIGNRSIFYVSANFDAPFFRSQSSEQAVAELHQQAQAKLNDTFLPLFKQNAPMEAIGSQATVNYLTNAPSNSNPDPFFNQIVYTADYIKNYQDAVQQTQYIDPQDLQNPEDMPESFTDLNDVNYGTEVKDLRSAVDEINKLKNVGDYTPVFASKTGAYMIARLQEKSGGAYANWQTFLETYKKEYVKTDPATAFKRQLNQGASLLTDRLASVKLPGEQTAEAAVNCGQHTASIQIRMVNADTGQTVQGNVSIRQTSGQCLPPNGSRSASGTGGASFSGTCYGSQPTDDFTVPAGYALVNVVRSAWTPSNINALGYYQVFVNVRPVNVTVNGSSTLVKSNNIGFGSGARLSSPNSIGLNASIVNSNSSSVSQSWTIGPNLSYQVCAMAPDTVTEANGVVWQRRNSSNQTCTNTRTGAYNYNVTWIYDQVQQPPPDPPPSCVLNGPNSVGQGSPATLSWSTSNATSFVISPATGVGTPVPSGSVTVYPNATTTYTGTARSASGQTANCSKTITVTPRPTCTLSSSSITGQNGTLSWTTTNATGLTIDQGIGSVTPVASGSRSVTVSSLSTVYQGTVTGPGGTNQCTGTITVIADEPYLRIYGNDVMAGGGFGAVCSPLNPTASIEAFAAQETVAGNTIWKGASAQFGAFALGPINNFFSANLRGPAGATNLPRPSLDLTFGNTNNGTSKVAINGGGFSGNTNCIPDYFAKRDVLQSGSSIGTTTVGNGSHQALYYDHDVHITGNISFANVGSWGGSVNTVPSYYLVVKGNIYIDPGVTQLDGVYIAQPDDSGNKGEIITCSNSSGITPGPGGCNQKLTVNGAFIARQVRFKRTNGKLASAVGNEAPSSANIAEVFNFSPEVYISPLHSTLERSLPFTKYDYITSLPPVL